MAAELGTFEIEILKSLSRKKKVTVEVAWSHASENLPLSGDVIYLNREAIILVQGPSDIETIQIGIENLPHLVWNGVYDECWIKTETFISMISKDPNVISAVMTQ